MARGAEALALLRRAEAPGCGGSRAEPCHPPGLAMRSPRGAGALQILRGGASTPVDLGTVDQLAPVEGHDEAPPEEHPEAPDAARQPDVEHDAQGADDEDEMTA